MSSELRRRYPALLLLAAGSLLAALSFWALEIARRSAGDTREPTVRTEPDYFIKEIEKCEAKRDEEIARVEAGLEEEDIQAKHAQQSMMDHEETEWERI